VRLISDSGFDRWALSELLGVEDPPCGVVWQRAPVAYSELDRLSEEHRLRGTTHWDDALACAAPCWAKLRPNCRGVRIASPKCRDSRLSDSRALSLVSSTAAHAAKARSRNF